jgi:hypothetical protein
VNDIICHWAAGFTPSATGAGAKGKNEKCCENKDKKYFFHKVLINNGYFAKLKQPFQGMQFINEI